MLASVGIPVSYVWTPSGCCSAGHTRAGRCPLYFTGAGELLDPEVDFVADGVLGSFKRGLSGVGSCVWEAALLTSLPTGPHYLSCRKITTENPYLWEIIWKGTGFAYLHFLTVPNPSRCGDSLVIEPHQWVLVGLGSDPLDYFLSDFDIKFFGSPGKAEEEYPSLTIPFTEPLLPYYP